jgi:hypothetical protein
MHVKESVYNVLIFALYIRKNRDYVRNQKCFTLFCNENLLKNISEVFFFFKTLLSKPVNSQKIAHSAVFFVAVFMALHLKMKFFATLLALPALCDSESLRHCLF